MKIVTHGGQAHADEVLAIALLLLKEGKKPGDPDVEICRTLENKRARDFKADGADFVIDVGGDADPRKGWFDHHQFPVEAAPACAFTLVARKYKVDLSSFDWAHKLAVIDSKGPTAWYKKVVGKAPSRPGDVSMLCGSSDSLFVYVASVANKDFNRGLTMAMEWLEHEFKEAEEFKKGFERSMQTAKVVDMGDFKIVFFDQSDPRGSIAATDKLAETHKDLIIAAMRDERGDGFSAVRINDNHRVDFTKVVGEKGCIFAHKSGFILKWENDWDGFLAAISKSVKRKPKPKQKDATNKGDSQTMGWIGVIDKQ